MILTFDNVHWFNNIIREFFGGIDYLIFSLISWILEGIFNLSNFMANPTLVELIYKRIYVILAIFMVFKLTMSFIKYLVNPDMFTDKEQGVGKLISRTIIMLLLLVAFPIIFFEPMPGREDGKTILNVLQNGVVKTLPKIILGVATDEEGNVEMDADANGNFMAVKMLESFYYPVECDIEGNDCTGDAEIKTELEDLKVFKDTLVHSAETGGVYAYQYMWPLTTISGILLVIILLGMAIDIAIRVFKIMLLQMIAPVPIMTYIDPKASKDGSFSSWTKQLISTFLELFIKLGTIYLLLLLISKMFTGDDEMNLFVNGINSIDGFMSRNFVRVFLIIGLFKFVKDAPKFLKNALGLKDNGGGGGFMGKAIAGMAGAAAGFAGGVIGGGLTGGLSGALTGFGMGSQNAGSGKPTKAFSQVRDNMAKATGRVQGGATQRFQQWTQDRRANRAGYQEALAREDKLKDDIKNKTIDKNNLVSQLNAAKQAQVRAEGNMVSRELAANIAKENAVGAHKNVSGGKYTQLKSILDYGISQGKTEAEVVAGMKPKFQQLYSEYTADNSLIAAETQARLDYQDAINGYNSANDAVADINTQIGAINIEIEQLSTDKEKVSKAVKDIEGTYSPHKGPKYTRRKPYK